MEKQKILSFIVILVFFVSVALLISFKDNISGTVDINQDNSIVNLDVYISSDPGCESCHDAEDLLAEEILPYFKDNISVFYYKVGSGAKYKDNYTKWSEYGFTSIPSIVVIHDITKNYSTLTYWDIITKDKLKNEIEKYLNNTQNITDVSNQQVYEFLGMKIDLSSLSLPVLTVVLGAIDSFNPCSFFVLLFLLSLLIYTKSRKRMMLIGSIFIFFSGFIYFLLIVFISFFLKILSIQLVISILGGTIAVIFGVLNIKDFFYFKKGISASISTEQKNKLYTQIRKIIKIDSIISLVFASAIFAVTANMVELLCSLALPVVYSDFLILYDISYYESILYILLYCIIYVIPLIIITSIVVITLGKWKLSEFQGRVLKLFSGIMIFSLGEILLLKPEVLHDLTTSLLIIASCLVVTVIVSQIWKMNASEKQLL